MGADTTDPSSGELYEISSGHMHPDYDGDELINDVAVIVLAEAASVDPIRFLTDDMGDDWIGREPLFIGYGYSPESGYGEKRSVYIPITYIYDDAFEYEGDDVNTCFGDSGGPALFTINGEPILIGVTSYGDDDCSVYGVNARVDPFTSFITQYIPEESDTTTSEDEDDTDDTDDTVFDVPSQDVLGYADLSPEGRSILYLANDLDVDELDFDAALDSRAAQNIVAFRAGDDGVLNTGDDDYFATLAELDAVSYVGVSVFTKLLSYAEQTGILTAHATTHGVLEYSDAAAAILRAANTLTEAQLDDDVTLDSRAAANIVARRESAAGDFRFLYELDQVSYVGGSAFSDMLEYAAEQGWY